MNTAKLPTSARFPPLPESKQSKPYEPAHGQAGHDGEPPVFATRKDFVYSEGKREPTESPENVNHNRVKWMLSRDQITQRMFNAADRHERDWNLSKIDPVASSVLVGNGGGGGDMHPNDAKRAAMWRRGNAEAALGRLYPMVELVVLRNMSVGKASAQLRIHNQAGMDRLRLGLSLLADHMKLPKTRDDD